MLRPDEYDKKEISLTSDRGPASEMVPVDSYVLNKMLRYIVQPFLVTESDRELVLNDARKVLSDPKSDPRSRLAAQKIIVAAEEVNLRRFEILDKVRRLETGQATENVQIKLSFPNRPRET